MPPPFSFIASQIYNSFEGNPSEKTDEVLSYFNKILSQGEEHYNDIAHSLDGVFKKIDDFEQIAAKQESLIQIKEILVTINQDNSRKLSRLNDSISELLDLATQGFEKIDAKVDQLNVNQNHEFSKIHSDNAEIKEISKGTASKVDNHESRLKILEQKLDVTFDESGFKPERIKSSPRNTVVTAEQVNQIEELRFERDLVKNTLVEHDTEIETNIDLSLKESNYLGYRENYGEVNQLSEQILAVDPENKIAKHNKKIALNKLEKFLSKERTYENLGIDLQSLASSMPMFFYILEFDDVVTETNSDGTMYAIQANRKKSILSKLGGTTKSIHVIIRGNPKKFTIRVGAGDLGKRLTMRAVADILTLDFGLGMISKHQEDQKFNKGLWSFISLSVANLAYTNISNFDNLRPIELKKIKINKKLDEIELESSCSEFTKTKQHDLAIRVFVNNVSTGEIAQIEFIADNPELAPAYIGEQYLELKKFEINRKWNTIKFKVKLKGFTKTQAIDYQTTLVLFNTFNNEIGALPDINAQ